MKLNYGFRQLPTDPAFARRSAAYLASQGYNDDAITNSLMSELQLPESDIDSILAELTPTAA